MKIRTGFVSNSSSSSFIIAADKVPKVTVSIEVDLMDYVHNRITTYKEFQDNWWGTDKEMLDKVKEVLAEGKTIYIGDFESYAEGAEYILHTQGIPPTDGIDVIYNERGH